MRKIKFSEYIKERSTSVMLMAILTVYTLFCVFSSVVGCFRGSVYCTILPILLFLFVPALFVLEYLADVRFGSAFVIGAYGLAAGSLLGSCYNFYAIIPWFDTALHGVSGFLFAFLGFMLAERFFGEIKGKRELFACIVFGVCVSLSIAVLWEIFEHCGSVFFNIDTQVDAITNEIHSHLLAGSHNDTVSIENITQTVIHYADGKTYVIDGYLDIGLADTLEDMIICLIGTVCYIPFAFLERKGKLKASAAKEQSENAEIAAYN